jgi:hypothetical protein
MLKQGIRVLSLQVGSPRCPDDLQDGDALGDKYVEALFNLLILDSKNFQAKKWWSELVTQSLCMDYNKVFGRMLLAGKPKSISYY